MTSESEAVDDATSVEDRSQASARDMEVPETCPICDELAAYKAAAARVVAGLCALAEERQGTDYVLADCLWDIAHDLEDVPITARREAELEHYGELCP